MSPKNDYVYIGHMIDNANKAISFIAGLNRSDFDQDEQLRLAVTHLLQIVGEAARRVSVEFREAHPEIPWKAIVGMRSKVVHDYFSVDDDVIWDTIKNDLPALVKQLETL
ncbi:DUF86 domain-containing protein [Limnothrix sp. FACHB-1083]|uniref:HepT-like ribonuclease domain-containing protein n=1 Tax=unclassified Limnothrix TaxID=2632864 RepID=UPI00168003DF|nr:MULTISPECIES: DUF86 domain-containing protein [unclassified Limnothrix]MBD2161590.1 DUF86 domain-containing protein [Limnothrix sp. FACHB-1083]MBD2192303.1 DUF86 domain-containing protein [Limnothrix sp. FACHB-1088]